MIPLISYASLLTETHHQIVTRLIDVIDSGDVVQISSFSQLYVQYCRITVFDSCEAGLDGTR